MELNIFTQKENAVIFLGNYALKMRIYTMAENTNVKTAEKTSFVVKMTINKEVKSLPVYKLTYNGRAEDSANLEKLLGLNPNVQDFSTMAPKGFQVLSALKPDEGSSVEIMQVNYVELIDTSKSPYVRSVQVGSVKEIEGNSISLVQLEQLSAMKITVTKAREKKAENKTESAKLPALDTMLE